MEYLQNNLSVFLQSNSYKPEYMHYILQILKTVCLEFNTLNEPSVFSKIDKDDVFLAIHSVSERSFIIKNNSSHDRKKVSHIVS